MALYSPTRGLKGMMQGSAMTQRSSTSTDDTVVTIRSYQISDLEDCREIFTRGMEQLISLVAQVVFPRYCWLLAAFGVFVVLVAFAWSLWIFVFYISACVLALALLYIDIYIECWKFINCCLATDLKDIDKSYMTGSDGCHMWVAQWQGRVVGMVGLVCSDRHKPARVAELQRMSVSPVCRRMGIGGKLLDELLRHAKEHKFEKLILTTTSAQTPAIRLYKKYGFKLLDVFPYPQKILTDLHFTSFYLQL